MNLCKLNFSDVVNYKDRNIERIFKKYYVEILQYCKNIYKADRKYCRNLATSAQNIINVMLLQY